MINKDKINIYSVNRKYHLEYEVLYTLECGIELLGFEVKAFRNRPPSILESYGFIAHNELFIKNLSCNGLTNHNRNKRLLVHKLKIRIIIG